MTQPVAARLRIQPKPRRGDPCGNPECPGKLTVQRTEIDQELGVRTQRIYCNVCPWHPEDNAIVIPLEFSPPQAPRRRK